MQKEEKVSDDNDKITFPIKINKNIWEKFKSLIPHSENLNDAVVKLIEEKIHG